MQTCPRIGYTLIEILVALFLFAVGGLALVATSAVIGRDLNENATRERAERIAASRLEILSASCRNAGNGRETWGRIESEWSVSHPDSSHVSLLESITRPTRQGTRRNIYRVTVPCRP
jgi:type II secretory pathway component PulJ